MDVESEPRKGGNATRLASQKQISLRISGYEGLLLATSVSTSPRGSHSKALRSGESVT